MRALAQMDDIAGHQFLGRQRGPGAVAAHAGLHVQLLAQERQRLLRAAFLQQAQHRIQHEQSADHRRLHFLTEKELDDDGGFQQPRDGRPEPLDEVPQRVGFLLHHRIGAELLQPALAPRRCSGHAGYDCRPQGPSCCQRGWWRCRASFSLQANQASNVRSARLLAGRVPSPTANPISPIFRGLVIV